MANQDGNSQKVKNRMLYMGMFLSIASIFYLFTLGFGPSFLIELIVTVGGIYSFYRAFGPEPELPPRLELLCHNHHFYSSCYFILPGIDPNRGYIHPSRKLVPSPSKGIDQGVTR